MKLIVYEETNGNMSIVVPLDSNISVFEIGRKDVPPGVDFWIIDETDIPSDHTYRDAWELDKSALGAPHGQGIGSDAWFAEQEASK